MYSREEIREALRESAQQEAAELGDMPSLARFEEYAAGSDVGAEERSRIRAWLCAYPEIAHMLVRPFEEE